MQKTYATFKNCHIKCNLKNREVIDVRGVSDVGFSIFADTDADFAF